MQGKMKMKGNMKKAMSFTPGLFPAPTAENLAKYAKPKLWGKYWKRYDYVIWHK